LGSVAELDTQIELVRRLQYLTAAETEGIEQQLARTRQLLHGVNRSLLRRQAMQVLLLAAVVLGGSAFLF
jgi:hypothetical protein